MHKRISSLEYKKLIEDIIRLINLNFLDSYLKLDTFFSYEKKLSSIIFRNTNDANMNYFYLNSKMMNCISYKKLLTEFLKYLNHSRIPFLKNFGKTYYEARIACDMMLN